MNHWTCFQVCNTVLKHHGCSADESQVGRLGEINHQLSMKDQHSEFAMKPDEVPENREKVGGSCCNVWALLVAITRINAIKANTNDALGCVLCMDGGPCIKLYAVSNCGTILDVLELL